MHKLVGQLEGWDAAADRTRALRPPLPWPRAAAEPGQAKVNIHLVSSSEKILPTLRPDFNHIAARTLVEQGVQLHQGKRVARIGRDQVELADGKTVASTFRSWPPE